MLALSDYELVSKCIDGDQDSFAELVARYKRLIYTTVYYFVRNQEEANEISQEVFIKIYKSLKRYNPEYKFSTWCISITKNLCIDYTRKKKVPIVDIGEYEQVTGHDNTPEQTYLNKERRMEIRDMINSLPEKYRTLIVLYHQHGMSYKEMADKLNKPMSIIKNRLHRARLELKKMSAAKGYV